MDIKPIKTDADYEAMLAEIERLWGSEAGSPDGDRLDVLATLVEAYEDKRWPIEAPDPVEAIKFRMEQDGLGQADLAKLLGSASRASEVLNRRRHLTLNMIWQLCAAWNIPAESLIRPYELERS